MLFDGRLVGTAGQSQRTPLAIPVPANGSTPYEGSGEIRIEEPGRPPHVTTAKIRAGAEVTIVAPRTLAIPEPEPEPATDPIPAESPTPSRPESRP